MQQLSATVGADSASYSAGDVATALNAANAILANPVGLHSLQMPAEISQLHTMMLSGISKIGVVEIKWCLRRFSDFSSASVSFFWCNLHNVVGGAVYTARLDNDAAEGSYSLDDLVAGLNAVDKSGMADANKVSFEKGDDGAILVRFDEQGANTTAVSDSHLIQTAMQQR